MHTTTLEYFQMQHDQLFKDVPTYLTHVCLTYLDLDVFHGETCYFDDPNAVDRFANEDHDICCRTKLSYRLLNYPFLDYAADS